MIQRFVHTLPPKVLKPALIMWHPLTDSRVEFYMFMLILILHREYVYIIFLFFWEKGIDSMAALQDHAKDLEPPNLDTLLRPLGMDVGY